MCPMVYVCQIVVLEATPPFPPRKKEECQKHSAISCTMQSSKAEDNDEVIFEADVILSQPSGSADLFLLQYPLRTTDVPIGTERVVEGVSIRPRYGRVEMRMAVMPSVKQLSGGRETCSASFDEFQDRAAEKAIGATQILRSQPANPKPHANYAAASFVTKSPVPALIVAPLRSVSQLRPTFDYLDERAAAIAKQRVDDRAARASVRGAAKDVTAKEPDAPAPLQLSFRRRESERAAARRKNSHASLARREAEEPWLPLSYVPVVAESGVKDIVPDESDASGVHGVKERIFGNSRIAAAAATVVKQENASSTAPKVPTSQQGDTHYMDLFQAHTRSVKLGIVAKGTTSAEPLSLRHMQRLPTNSAVSQLVTFARVVRFDDLLRVAPPAVPTEEVLNATRIVAVCLRGCWVAKNGPRSGAVKAKRGTERYDAARALIHNLFRKSIVVKTADAMAALGSLPAFTEEVVVTILSEVARRERKTGWTFKIEDDELFLDQNRELVTAQNADWDRRVAMANNVLGLRQQR